MSQMRSSIYCKKPTLWAWWWCYRCSYWNFNHRNNRFNSNWRTNYWRCYWFSGGKKGRSLHVSKMWCLCWSSWKLNSLCQPTSNEILFKSCYNFDVYSFYIRFFGMYKMLCRKNYQVHYRTPLPVFFDYWIKGKKKRKKKILIQRFWIWISE